MSAVIDCFFSIVVYILMIGKDSNCLLSSSTSLYSNQCRRDHTHSRFYKFIIHSVIRIRISIPLFTIITIIFFSKLPSISSSRTDSPVTSSVSYITSIALTSILNFIMERRDLKTFLIPTHIKKG